MVRNTSTEWGWPAKLLHWIGALAVLVLLVHGWWMVHMTPRPERFANYLWHAALGYDLMALLVLRLVWRWLNPVPALPRELARWERLSAQAGHVGLYLLMLGATLSGWALAGTFRNPMTKDLMGLPVPPVVRERAWHDLLEASHFVLSYLLAALVVVHVLGSLRHHLLKHNDVLRRMWLGAPAP
jgi:cytochrome b561